MSAPSYARLGDDLEEGSVQEDTSMAEPLTTPRSSKPGLNFRSAYKHSRSISGSSVPLLAPPPHNRHSSVSSINSEDSVASRLSVADRYSLAIDPSEWPDEFGLNDQEEDDYLHTPDPKRDRNADRGGTVFTCRGLANIGFLILLAIGLLMLFAIVPVILNFTKHGPSNLGAHNIGGVNGSGQVPVLSSRFALVDPDTPGSANFYTSQKTGSEWQVIFSDEFNVDNRTFYPGDDPYWEAVDLYYWVTGDYEYYDPKAVITQNGNLVLTISEEDSNSQNYTSGHLQGWNKFCFTGGYVEVNVSLPGSPKVSGFWPAVWMMGNPGRAGYAATTDGVWPYSYDSCDVGTLANQTLGDQPTAALTSNDGGPLSFLPGQRLSACTCPGETDHPGPKAEDGSFPGRMAPEIDIFEATTNAKRGGTVSQSGQFAPFNTGYSWANGTSDITLFNTTLTDVNNFRGNNYQEAVSAVTTTNQNAYEETNGFAVYGVEWLPGPDGYITWFSDGKPGWSMNPSAIGSDPLTNISARIIPPEPMYLLMNLGLSPNFAPISPKLHFPATMKIDYVRVYQDPNNRQVGCNPDAYPTEDYINKHLLIYTNPNLTTFSARGNGGYGGLAASYNATFPKNRLIDTC